MTAKNEPVASVAGVVREVCAHPDGSGGHWLAVNGGITLPLPGDLAGVLYPTRKVRIDVHLLDE